MAGRNLLLIILLLLSQPYLAVAQSFDTVKDLSSTWYYTSDEVSLPYVKGNNLNPRAIYFELNLKRYADNYLVIEHPYPGVVFVDGKVFIIDSEEVSFKLPIDSLLRVFPSNEILVTYFSENGEYDKLSTTISTEVLATPDQLSTLEPVLRDDYDRNGLIIILITILVFYAIALNSNPKAFQDFYSFEQALAGRIKDDSVYKLKLFSQTNLAIFLFHASIISFLIILLSKYSPSLFSFEKYFIDSVLIDWALLSIFVFFAFFVKYIVIRYIGELFDLGNSANYYFYEFMRLSMTFFFIVFAISSIIFISFPHIAGSMVRTGLHVTFVFMVVRLIFLFFRMGKVSGFKNVHLFSYLCTTETLPIIVGMRYFLA